jgi:VanZ family protein
LDYPDHLIIVFGLMSGEESKRYLPPLIWAGLIILGSSIPNLSGLETGITVGDKIVHFAEYFILGFLTARAFLKLEIRKWGKIAGLVAVLAAFAVMDELHQALIPGRTVEKLDMTADIFGLLTSTLLYVWLARRNRARRAQGKTPGFSNGVDSRP